MFLYECVMCYFYENLITMKDELISFETAKLAKEKGFDEECYNGYFESNGQERIGSHLGSFKNSDWKEGLNRYCRSSQSLLQKWLREKHYIHIEISPSSDTDFGVLCGTAEEPSWVRGTGEDEDPLYFKTYEEALEAGLLESLKLIK